MANIYMPDGTTWASKLANVVEDTTPQLGGDLDCNGKDITGAVEIVAATSGDMTFTISSGKVFIFRKV